MTWKFEWDPEKANRNLARHGVAFEQGARAFADKFAVEWIDDREDYGEERVNLLGCATACSCTRRTPSAKR
jgi:uncharacterized protein